MDRGTKVIPAILFVIVISLALVHYSYRRSFVDWSDVEKIAKHTSNVAMGDTVHIQYYLVNPRSHDIKVKPVTDFNTSFHYTSKPDVQNASLTVEDYGVDYLTVKSRSRECVHTEKIETMQLGTLHVHVSGLPDAEILVLPRGYNYSCWQSRPYDQIELLTDFLPVETVVDYWWDEGLKVFIPPYLPHNIEPTGAWTHVDGERLGSYAVFVFSAYNRTDIATAEIIMGVSEEDMSVDENASWGININLDPGDVEADIALSVPVRYREFLEMYGPYSTRVQMRIGSLYYWMRVEPSILLEDIIKIVSHMVPITDL